MKSTSTALSNSSLLCGADVSLLLIAYNRTSDLIFTLHGNTRELRRRTRIRNMKLCLQSDAGSFPPNAIHGNTNYAQYPGMIVLYTSCIAGDDPDADYRATTPTTPTPQYLVS